MLRSPWNTRIHFHLPVTFRYILHDFSSDDGSFVVTSKEYILSELQVSYTPNYGFNEAYDTKREQKVLK